MSPVHKLSQIGSLTGNKIDYPSMLAGYGDFGALQRIGWATGTGSSGTINFSGIPQNMQDLFIVCNFTTTSAANFYITFNNDSGANYSETYLNGNGSSASSGRDSVPYINRSTTISSTPVSAIIHILNYANTSTFKTAIARYAGDMNGSGETNLPVILWRSTTAISSVQIISTTSITTAGRFALYGVRASAA